MQVETLESVPAELLEQLKRVSTATAWAEMLKLGVRRTAMSGIYPLAPLGAEKRVVGRAVTLRYLPAREDLVERGAPRDRPYRQAIEAIEPDDVLVMDAMGSLECGTIGDILAARLKYRGAAGVVVDGAVRDAPFMRRMDLPVFVKGVHPASRAATLTPAEVNIPIQCGGVVVLPGDIILADEDGVLVVPRKLAAQVAQAGEEHEDLEVFIRARIEEGRSTFDVYPPNDAVRREYAAQRAQR